MLSSCLKGEWKMKNNNIIFLSHPLTEKTPSYGNRDKFIISKVSDISKGATANTSEWIFTNNHIGTHIDVPYHFDNEGKKISDYNANDWIFTKVGVVELNCKNAVLINEKDLSGSNLEPDIEILLIKTGYEKYRNQEKYWNDNPGLSPSVAPFLRENFNNLRCIGFDFISITSWKFREEGRVSHKAFLSPRDNKKPIMAIEDMSLKNISGEIDWLIVAPIIVEGGNGAPVTVIANQKNTKNVK